MSGKGTRNSRYQQERLQVIEKYDIWIIKSFEDLSFLGLEVKTFINLNWFKNKIQINKLGIHLKDESEVRLLENAYKLYHMDSDKIIDINTNLDEATEDITRNFYESTTAITRAGMVILFNLIYPCIYNTYSGVQFFFYMR